MSPCRSGLMYTLKTLLESTWVLWLAGAQKQRNQHKKNSLTQIYEGRVNSAALTGWFVCCCCICNPPTLLPSSFGWLTRYHLPLCIWHNLSCRLHYGVREQLVQGHPMACGSLGIRAEVALFLVQHSNHYDTLPF